MDEIEGFPAPLGLQPIRLPFQVNRDPFFRYGWL